MFQGYEELTRRATKGDEKAIRELFALAEKLASERRFKDASSAFRDSAIAYRIAAFRNKAHAEEAESQAKWIAVVRDIHRQWIEQNPKGMREIPRKIVGIERECIRRVLLEELMNEPFYYAVVSYLGGVLSAMGMEFYSPGGSVERRVWYLLNTYFGVDRSSYFMFLENTDVRIGIDLLAEEIEKRCQSLVSGTPTHSGFSQSGTPKLTLVKS